MRTSYLEHFEEFVQKLIRDTVKMMVEDESKRRVVLKSSVPGCGSGNRQTQTVFEWQGTISPALINMPEIESRQEEK